MLCIVKESVNGKWELDVQERAYVTGLIAANLVCQRLDVGVQAPILPVEEDEMHIRAGRDAVRSARRATEALGLQTNIL